MADHEPRPEEAGPGDNSGAASYPLREISFQHSSRFVPILEHLNCSILVSTYAAGKLISVGRSGSELSLGFSNFQHAMGLAIGGGKLAVGGPNLVWSLHDALDLAPRIEPAGIYDRGFLARESFVTGNIHVHELAWGERGELWLVNTLFSCLCTLHEDYNFVPRWQPPFISELAAQDRCHLNGLAMESGRPRYVTALGCSDQSRGWRETKANGGVIIDVDTGKIVARGLCMPHSPRLYREELYVLDSGRGRLVRIDRDGGEILPIADYPGYGRGLSFCGQFAFIGMSKARETSVFGGVPICQKPGEMRCGIVVVDLLSKRAVAFLELQSGVDELFDVQILQETKRAVVCGPYPVHDQQPPVWVVPTPEATKRIANDRNKVTDCPEKSLKFPLR